MMNAALIHLLLSSLIISATGQPQHVNGTGVIGGALTALRNMLTFSKSSERQCTSHQHIQVFVAGFGRTGTSSLTLALEHLGYTPMHGGDIAVVANDVKSLYEGKISPDDLFSKVACFGFNVTGMDILNHFWRWSIDKPDVKVILTARDTPDSWVQSFLGVADHYTYMTSLPFSLMPGMLQPLLRDIFLNEPTGGQPSQWRNPTVLREGYLKRQNDVIASIPANRLLVFNVKEGWGPLCSFLEKPIPSIPFPRANDKAFMDGVAWVLWAVTWIWPLVPLLVLVVIYNTVMKSFRRGKNQSVCKNKLS